jgi:hypothetical protein
MDEARQTWISEGSHVSHRPEFLTRGTRRPAALPSAAGQSTSGLLALLPVAAAGPGRRNVGLALSLSVGRLRSQRALPEVLQKQNTKAPPARCNARPAYSAGTSVVASAGKVIGSARPLNLSQANRMSRNSRTQALGARKCEANSRSISSGRQ